MQSGVNQASGSKAKMTVRMDTASGGSGRLLLADGTRARYLGALPRLTAGPVSVQGPFHREWSSDPTTLCAPAVQPTSAHRPVQRAGGSRSGIEHSARGSFHGPCSLCRAPHREGGVSPPCQSPTTSSTSTACSPVVTLGRPSGPCSCSLVRVGTPLVLFELKGFSPSTHTTPSGSCS